MHVQCGDLAGRLTNGRNAVDVIAGAANSFSARRRHAAAVSSEREHCAFIFWLCALGCATLCRVRLKIHVIRWRRGPRKDHVRTCQLETSCHCFSGWQDTSKLIPGTRFRHMWMDLETTGPLPIAGIETASILYCATHTYSKRGSLFDRYARWVSTPHTLNTQMYVRAPSAPYSDNIINENRQWIMCMIHRRGLLLVV